MIGQNCNIGAGTIIKNSYIFENTIIGARCVVERSIIGAGVVVKDGSHVPLGCLIAEGVVIGPDAMLDPYERLSVKRNEIIGAGGFGDGIDDNDDDDSDIEEVEASKLNHSPSLSNLLIIDWLIDQELIDKTSLGKDSNAIVWPREPPDEEDDEEGPENFKNQRYMRIGGFIFISFRAKKIH